MYIIKAGDNLIYSPTLAKQNYVISNPTLSIEINKSETLSFNVPHKNKRRELLQAMKPEVKVYDGDMRIFRGRVLTRSKDFQRSRQIYCEGDLSYLRDVIVRPEWSHTGTVSGYFTYMIGKYNEIASIYKRFKIGRCTVVGENINRTNDQYPDVLSELTDKLLNQYGGFLQTRCEVENGVEVTYIDYLDEPGEGKQVIRYGKNLIDLSESEDSAPIYTRIIPLGANIEQKRLTIGGSGYIENTTATDKYGLIEQVVTYDEETTVNGLRTKGQKDLDNAVNPQTTIEITAMDMSIVEKEEDRLTVGKIYRILSVPNGYVETWQMARLNRLELKLDNPVESLYYFGNVKTGILQEAVSTNRVVNQVAQVATLTASRNEELERKVATMQNMIKNIVDSITQQSTIENWVHRKWTSGLSEYFSVGLSITWNWTEDTDFYMSESVVQLPEVMSIYSAFVTAISNVTISLSIEQNETYILVHALTKKMENISPPTDSILNFYILSL